MLSHIGREKQDTLNEILWQNSISQIRNEGEGRTTILTWHTSFLFVIIFAIIPYLILKIMSNVRQIQIQGKDYIFASNNCCCLISFLSSKFYI